MIRIPDIPGLNGTRLNNPGVSAAAIAAPAVALGNVAETIAGVSDHFHDTAIRIQKIENARTVSEKRMQLASEYANLQLELEKDPDPASRISRTRDFLGQMKGQMDTADAPQAVRDELVNHFDGFANQAMIRQAEDSSRLSIQRGKLALQNEMELHTRNRNRPGMERAVRTAGESGLLLPEEEQAVMQNYDETANRTELGMIIEENPAMVMKDLESADFLTRNPGVSPDDLPKLKSAVKASMERKRAEEMDAVELALENNQTISDEDLAASEYLTPLDIAKIKNAREMEKSPEGSVHAKAWDMLFSQREAFQDPSITDERYAEIWNENRAKVLGMIPSKYQGDIKSELQYRSPANRQLKREQPDAAYTKTDLVMIARSAAARARDAGVFGDPEEKEFSKREATYRKAEDITLQVKQFVTTYPDSTPEQVREFTDKLIGVKIDGETSLLPPAPPAYDFNADIDRLINMTPMPTVSGKDARAADPLQVAPGPSGSSDTLLPPRSPSKTAAPAAGDAEPLPFQFQETADGPILLLPAVSADGKPLTRQQAIDQFYETNQTLGTVEP